MFRTITRGAALATAAPLTSLCLIICNAYAAAPTTSELLDGVIARAEVIYTIQLDYTCQATFEEHDSKVDTQPLRQLRTAIQGNDWITRSPVSPNYIMRRNHATFRFIESVDVDGATSASIHITAPETHNSLVQGDIAHAGPRLGTLWYAEQLAFVSQNRTRVERLPAQTLDGVEVEVLQWQIAATDFDEAFLVIPPEIAAARRGLLRLYVAPKYDCILPRIEYVSPKGKVELVTDAREFQRVGPRLWFPKRASHIVTCTDGLDRNEFDVIAVTNVNQELPAETFQMEVPPHTRVRDSRPGMPVSIFSLDNEQQLTSFRSGIEDSMPAVQSKSALLLITNSTLLVLCTLLWIYSKWRSSLTS